MNSKKLLNGLLMLVMMSGSSGLAFANQSRSSSDPSASGATFKQSVAKTKAACMPDVDKYCKDIQEGEGRIAACLDSKGDSISPGCRTARGDLNAMISKKMDKADVAFRKNCGSDVQKFCSSVPSGKGRLLECLGKKEDSLSNSCKAFEKKIEEKAAQFLG